MPKVTKNCPKPVQAECQHKIAKSGVRWWRSDSYEGMLSDSVLFVADNAESIS